MTRHDAQMVNLDDNTHIDGDGNEQKTSDANPAHIGPLTIMIAASHGHPAMRYGDHHRQRTTVHAHVNRNRSGHPHPSDAAKALANAARRLPRAR